MTQGKPGVWFVDDPKPNIFFFRQPFRSWKFLVNTVLVAVMCLASVAVIWKYGPIYILILAFLPLNVVYPYWWAIKRHGKIRQLYLAGEISVQSPGSPVDSLLQVADDSMNEGLRNSSVTFGLFLLAIVLSKLHS